MAFKDFFRRRPDKTELINQLKQIIESEQKSFSVKTADPIKTFMADLLTTESSAVIQPYSSSIWVYRCINVWNQISTVPLKLLDDKGNAVTSGKELFLLNSPASDMTSSLFVEYLILSLGTGGEFFILREDGQQTDKNVLPKYLTIVSPDSMLISESDLTPNGKIKSWTMTMNGGLTRKIPVEGVIHDLLPNPYNSNRGLSPLEAIKLSVDSEYASRQHNKWMMERHGRISGIVSFGENVGMQQLTQMADMWREKYEGADNAGKTAFLDSGAKYQQLTLSAKDMDWLEGQKLSREEICAAFGVPPCNAGILDKATYSNFDQSTRSLWTDTLIPIGKKIENCLNKYIYTPASGGKYHVEFDFINTIKILQANENEKIDRYIKLVKEGMVTPEQAAQLTGIKLGKIEDAHKVIWGTINLVPVNDILESGNDIASPPKDEPIKGIIDIDEIKKDLLPPTLSQSSKQLQGDNLLKNEIRQARGRSIIRQAAGYERQLRQVMKRYFNDQHKAVADNISKITSHLKAQQKDGAILKIKQTPNEMADLLLKGKDWNKELLKRTSPILRATGILSAKNTLVELGKDKSSFMENTLSNFFRKQQTLLEKVNDTTKQGLIDASRTMVQSLNDGKSPEESANILKDEVDAEFGRTAASRAITIARTETLRAVNGARYEEMSEVGIDKHEWLAVMDDAVRESHKDQDGWVVRIGEKFPNGCEYPLDPSADAGETINCRCTTVAVFK